MNSDFLWLWMCALYINKSNIYVRNISAFMSSVLLSIPSSLMWYAGVAISCANPTFRTTSVVWNLGIIREILTPAVRWVISIVLWIIQINLYQGVITQRAICHTNSSLVYLKDFQTFCGICLCYSHVVISAMLSVQASCRMDILDISTALVTMNLAKWNYPQQCNIWQKITRSQIIPPKRNTILWRDCILHIILSSKWPSFNASCHWSATITGWHCCGTVKRNHQVEHRIAHTGVSLSIKTLRCGIFREHLN